MSRIIKFRVWLKDSHRMIDLGTHGALKQTLQSEAKLVFGENFHDDFIDFGTDAKDFELLQFTGLHDRNGKPIYEGDIVYSDYYKAQFEVRWCDGKGEFLRSQLGWILSNDRYAEPLEAHLEVHELDREEYFSGRVLGNIYENSDLLK